MAWWYGYCERFISLHFLLWIVYASYLRRNFVTSFWRILHQSFPLLRHWSKFLKLPYLEGCTHMFPGFSETFSFKFHLFFTVFGPFVFLISCIVTLSITFSFTLVYRTLGNTVKLLWTLSWWLNFTILLFSLQKLP